MTEPHIFQATLQRLSEDLPDFYFSSDRSQPEKIEGRIQGNPKSSFPKIEVNFFSADNGILVVVWGNLRGRQGEEGDDVWYSAKTIPYRSTSANPENIVALIKRLLRAVKCGSAGYIRKESPPVGPLTPLDQVFCYWFLEEGTPKPIPPRFVFTTQATAVAQIKQDEPIGTRAHSLPIIHAVPLRTSPTTPEETAALEKQRAKDAALAKLTPAERDLLGF